MLLSRTQRTPLLPTHITHITFAHTEHTATPQHSPTYRVRHRAGTSVGVDLLPWDAQVGDDGHRDNGEGLIHFKQIHLMKSTAQ
jgi:D-alanyl-D-alanine dipeptidase